MTFLKCFGVWAAFSCLPPFVFFSGGSRTKPDDAVGTVLFFLPFLLIPAVGSLVRLSPIFNRDKSGKAMLAGVLLGISLPIVLGFVYMQVQPSFENGGPIIMISVLTAAFNACGGALAGWLRSRPN